MTDRRIIRRRRLLVWGGLVALGLAATFLLSGWWLLLCAFAVWQLSRPQGVPVMVYHAISPKGDWLPWADNIVVRPDVFAAQMAWLSRSRWQVVSSTDVFHGAGPGCLALQFDDAYFDFLHGALPVLRRYQMPATVFASTDFIDGSSGVRATPGDWRGYLNADELRMIDRDPLFEVASHGKDHARIATGPSTTPRDPAHWGKETAYLWSLIPGDKARWFETAPPTAAEVPQNDSALCGVGLDETPEAQKARVTANLQAARADLSGVLDRDVTVLCWPFDRVTPEAETAARAVGFTHFTGGRADNGFDQPCSVMSRSHITDHAMGGGPIWVEVLLFRARLGVAAGNLLWWPVTTLASRLRARRYQQLHGPHIA